MIEKENTPSSPENTLHTIPTSSTIIIAQVDPQKMYSPCEWYCDNFDLNVLIFKLIIGIV
jgi:hypothetical protein